MKHYLQLNADRFMGFADVYDNARPKCPEKVKDIILKYLGCNPSIVVDLGCGTGLTTTIWSALSQGGLQIIIKANIEEINPLLESFKARIFEIFGNSEFIIEFCYRMRIGIK